MKISNEGLKLVKSFEGCHLTAYRCPAGVWTIGYGHTSGVKEGMRITQEQADAYLASDLEKYEKYVTNTKLDLNQNQFDALVSFAYNCGNGNLKTLVQNIDSDCRSDTALQQGWREGPEWACKTPPGGTRFVRRKYEYSKK